MGALERVSKPKIEAIALVIEYVERQMPRVIPMLLAPRRMGPWFGTSTPPSSP
jgi:hypothetical protein